MSYNGSGTFVINSTGQPVVTGTVISSSVFNALTADLGTGLSTAITKDGQTTTTARVPFAFGVNSTLTTDATSALTGSIITAGGISTQKALFVGTTSSLAVATATSVNKVTITAPATSATLTIADGKTLTASNTLTFTGTDSSTLNVGTGGTLGTSAYVTLGTGVATFLATPSSSNLLAAVTDETGTGSLVFATSPTLGGTVVGASSSWTGDNLFSRISGGASIRLGAGLGILSTESGANPLFARNVYYDNALAQYKVQGNSSGGWGVLRVNENGASIASATGAVLAGDVVSPSFVTLVSLTGTQTLTNKTLTSPTLTTPVLGVASATSINKVAITAPATGSTLTIIDGKTFTASNTLTLTATDNSTLAIGTGGTLGTAAYKATGTSGNTVPLLDGTNTFSGANTVSLAGTPLRLTNTTDAAANLGLIIESDRATPAISDQVYAGYYLSSDVGTQLEFGRIAAVVSTVTAASSAGYLLFSARTGNSLTSVMRMTSTVLSPHTTDGMALGSTTLMWADLFLASGGVVNWNNGDVTITHSANTLTFAGASSGSAFDVAPNVAGDSVMTRGATETVSGAKTFTTEPNFDFAAASDNGLRFRTAASSLRWKFVGSTTAESGSDAGSNLSIFRYSDAGAFLGDAFVIYRATGGMVMSGATGGDKGTGTINAAAVYDDGTLLTCYVLEVAVTGSVDMAKWDKLVPNRVIPAVTKTVDDTDAEPDADGVYPTKIVEVEPEVIEERIHTDARKFVSRLGTESDPLDIDKYAAHWKSKRHLTSMPNKDNFDIDRNMGTGTWIQRLVETVEIQAVHIDQLNQRLKALEAGL